MVHRIKGIVGQARERGFVVATDDDHGGASLACGLGHAVKTARLAGVRDQHDDIARFQCQRKTDGSFTDGARHAAQAQLRKLKRCIERDCVRVAHGGELDNAGVLKRVHNCCQRIVVDAVDRRIKLAHLGGEDVLKTLLHVVERDFVG